LVDKTDKSSTDVTTTVTEEDLSFDHQMSSLQCHPSDSVRAESFSQEGVDARDTLPSHSNYKVTTTIASGTPVHDTDSPSILKRIMFAKHRSHSSQSLTSKDDARKRWTTAITAVVKHGGNPIGSLREMSESESITNLSELRSRILLEQEEDPRHLRSDQQGGLPHTECGEEHLQEDGVEGENNQEHLV
jgi:hypothetical protein